MYYTFATAAAFIVDHPVPIDKIQYGTNKATVKLQLYIAVLRPLTCAYSSTRCKQMLIYTERDWILFYLKWDNWYSVPTNVFFFMQYVPPRTNSLLTQLAGGDITRTNP